MRKTPAFKSVTLSLLNLVIFVGIKYMFSAFFKSLNINFLYLMNILLYFEIIIYEISLKIQFHMWLIFCIVLNLFFFLHQ